MNPDLALGLDVDFDEEGFRSVIKATMQIGTHPDPDRRPKFVRKGGATTYWKDGLQLAYTPRMGREGEPLDPEIEVREPEPVVITDADCAVEVAPAEAEELPVGNFRPVKVTTTLLDVDYAKIEGCKELVYNGDQYRYGYEPEAPGLFNVGVHMIIWYALDEG